MADRTPGIYVRLDANYDTDEAMLEVSPMAELLFIRALALSKRKQTDGFVAARSLNRCGLRITEPLLDLVGELVTAGLWTDHPDGCGWDIAGWGKWQLTTAEVAAASARNRSNALRRHHKEGRHDYEPHDECELCATRIESAPDSMRQGSYHANGATRQDPFGATRTGGNAGSSSHQGCKRPGCRFGFIDQEDRSVIPCPGYISEAAS